MRLKIISLTLHPVQQLNARPRSASDLTLTLQNLRLTPEERIRKLDDFISGIAMLKAPARILGPTNADTKQDR